MPVSLDEISGTFNADSEPHVVPEKTSETPRLRADRFPPVGVADAWLTPMVADPLAVHRSIAESITANFVGVTDYLASIAHTEHALAHQFDVGRAITSLTASVTSSPDAIRAIHANIFHASPFLSAGRAAWPWNSLEDFTQRLSSILQPPPPILPFANIDAYLPQPNLAEVLSTFDLTRQLAESAQALMRQMVSPHADLLQQVMASHTTWQFDPWQRVMAGLTGRFDDLFFPTGTLLGELNVLLLATTDPGAVDPVRVEEAITAVVEDIPWRVHDRRVWDVIVARAKDEGTSPGAIMRRELHAAVFLAVASRDAPQTVRLGAEWVIDDDGRKAELAPQELPMQFFWQWVAAKAIAIAEASLLEQPYLDGGAVPAWSPRASQTGSVVSLDAGWEHPERTRPYDLLLVDSADPLMTLVAQQERDDDAARLLATLKTASPRQRELLALLAVGLSEAEAARRLGIAPATARVQLHRLRQKVM